MRNGEASAFPANCGGNNSPSDSTTAAQAPLEKLHQLTEEERRLQDKLRDLENERRAGLAADVRRQLDDHEAAVRYYRERAIPYLVPFPVKTSREAADPLPEGLDVWDVGSPVTAIDWTGTLALSPVVVPGVTTRERTYGTTEGGEPKKVPLDLYVGIDCSGSMGNPAANLSYPVLAGTIVHGPLSCSGNAVTPTDSSVADTVDGPSSGQCAALG